MPLPDFLIVDDNALDSHIIRKVIEAVAPHAAIQSFHNAGAALSYIKEHEGMRATPLPTVIFMDVHMPLMNGFEAAEAFQKMPQAVQNGYRLHMLSSSIHEDDFTRAKAMPSVQQYIVKPLAKSHVEEILRSLQQTSPATDEG